MIPKLTPVLTNANTKRGHIRQKVVEGLQESFPIQSRSKILEVDNLQVVEKDYSPHEQKMAILQGDTLSESIKGTIRMKDKNGEVIDEVENFTIARIPWFTPRHTMVVGGNEYSVANQVRPKPGVYARKRANGILEANFNTKGGSNFNVTLDPEKGEPQLEYGTTKIPLYPILREAGVSHERISRHWGARLADQNEKALMPKSKKTIDRLYKKVVPAYHQVADADTTAQIKEVFSRYTQAQMDPEVNSKTLGKPYSNVTPDAILDASDKVLKIFKNPKEVDDRDNLDFKALHSVDDFFKEVISLNARDVARKAAIKMEVSPSLRKALPAGPFTGGILRFINNSQLVSVPTQTNPMELIDSSMRVTSMGEGGIQSDRAIPMEARQIHVTQMGALDPFRTPESFRAGVDIRAAMELKKDQKGNIYVPVRDVKTNKNIHVRAGVLRDKVVAFPNQKLSGTVDALVEGQIRKTPASNVQYQVPHASMMYSPTTNLVPFIESLQGNRAVMGSKMQVQALSLVGREAPMIQVMSPKGKSYEHHMGNLINPVAPVSGTVSKIDENYIYIQPDKVKTSSAGKELVKIPYETDFPLAAKTYLNHDVTVKKGDSVKSGQQIGESNFSKDGVLALGKNLSVAYMPYHGANSNDAVVISEGAAKKLTSERMYTFTIPRDNDMTLNKDKHRVYYGQGYKKNQYSTISADGLVKPGTKILPGDPLMLGLRKSTMTADDLLLGRLHRSLARPYREQSQLWDHDHEGEVIDVVKTPKRVAITVKTKEPMGIGDKLSGRFGNKGVVSQIVPDAQMIQDESGKVVDILMTSAGVVSRTNPAQIIETAVGKVAEKTGKPIIVENLTGRDNVQWAKDLLKKHNIKDKETLFDPMSGKKLPNVFVGRQFIMKLMKSTDTNYSARGIGSYDVNLQPTKGGVASAKALGKMEFDALIGHNARNILREASTIKSQKNDEYWKAVQLGYPTPPPKASFAYDKFLGMLTGAGVKVNRDSNRLSLAPLTDKSVLDMSSGEIKEPKIIKAKNFTPEAGGLFDPAFTGGLTGSKWSHISLAEPIVSPVFRDPARRLLGLTNPGLDKMLEEKGGKYIQQELAKIDPAQREKEILKSMKNKSANNLDNDVKQVKFLRSLQKQGLRPDEATIITKVPVVPPVFRPILPGRGGQEILYGDINPLYRDLIYTNNQMKEVRKAKILPDEERRLRPTLNAAVGAVYGINDPVTSKSKARGHKGFLTYISGVNSPKQGYFHSKILKKTQDIAGRGTIVPDSTLGMDDVGLPEDMMWTMYDKFLVKKLVQNGYSALQASQMIKDRAPAAKNMLLREANERPVIINRAPTLHRYSMIGAFPKLVPGKTIRVNPFVEAGTNSDYDGDCSDTVIIVKLEKPLKLNEYRELQPIIDAQITNSGANTDSGIDSTTPPGYYHIHVRDLPHITRSKVVKGNKEIYEVPKGLSVFGFSQRLQRVELCEVTKFSVHHDLSMLMITTTTGRTVCVSEDRSLFGFNPETCSMDRFSALEHPDWAIPRAARLTVAPELGIKLKALYTSAKNSEVKHTIPLRSSVGWLLGVIVGDGWVSYQTDVRRRSEELKGHAIGLASVDRGTQDAFVKECKALLNPGVELKWKLYDNVHTYEGHDCFSQKLHIHNSRLAQAIGELFEYTQGAVNKRLPSFFTQAPREFLLGLLAGLIDTDGTVSIVQAKAKNKPQIIVHYTTISPRLADEVATLGLLLGVKTRVHAAKRKTQAGNTEYQVHFSTPDLQKIALEIPCKVDYKLANLKKLSTWDFSNSAIASKDDRVPLPAQFIPGLKKLVGSSRRKSWKNMQEEEIVPLRKRESIQVILSKAKRTGKIGRSTLNALIEIHGYTAVGEATSFLWLDLMLNPSIIWDFIDNVEPIEGRHTAWDLTVPDGNTFMTSNQLIVYDTMMVHVPIGNKAVDEAKQMTLSNVLYGDKSRNDLLVFPQHEAIMGIAHAAETDDKNKPKVFKSQKDAMNAYREGKIGLGTRVKIGK